MQKVDIVYTYVDGSDAKWLTKKSLVEEKLLGRTTHASSSSRFIDNEELKYSLRSIDKFATWVNNIFIVTDDQIPSWLNLAHPKIKIIDHKDIFSKEEYLPNFNAKAIETQIHHIKELSEHFIYFNDDMFLGRITKPADFFDINGKPRIFVSEIIPIPNKNAYRFDKREESKKNDYQESVINTRILYKNYFGKKIYYNIRHGVKTLLKSVLVELELLFPNEVHTTAANKFRSGQDLMMFHLCQFYCIDKKLGKPVYLQSIGNTSKLKNLLMLNNHNSFYFINLDNNNLAASLQNITKTPPFVFCLNQTPSTPVKNLEVMKTFLENYFPNKSQYEK